MDTHPVFEPNPSWQQRSFPPDSPPVLCVVVDTEEEFDWNSDFNPEARSTSNILEQPLAQQIMDRYGIVPTYVVDYPVADNSEAVAVLQEIKDDKRCEIGAHLHPWVNPPYGETIDEFHSYPGNLTPDMEHEKLAKLTIRIETAFNSRPTIYKAGRYGIGPYTYQILEKLGYTIDTSVVPHTDFSKIKGPNFIGFPAQPFNVNQHLISLPHTVHFLGALSRLGPDLYPYITNAFATRMRLGRLAAKLRALERFRLTPEGYSLQDMKRQTQWALSHGEKYFMLSYHSSTLLPGATDYARNLQERSAFLEKLEAYFHFFIDQCGGKPITASNIALHLSTKQGAK